MICDCERSQNGLGAAGRECDCPAGNPDRVIEMVSDFVLTDPEAARVAVFGPDRFQPEPNPVVVLRDLAELLSKTMGLKIDEASFRVAEDHLGQTGFSPENPTEK